MNEIQKTIGDQAQQLYDEHKELAKEQYSNEASALEHQAMIPAARYEEITGRNSHQGAQRKIADLTLVVMDKNNKAVRAAANVEQQVEQAGEFADVYLDTLTDVAKQEALDAGIEINDGEVKE